ncbi:MAG: SPASM domain-containing protein, partial [Actinobacteria bacterium]|nr:SPASM domain-containing protein [Actinomycetota bacterium]
PALEELFGFYSFKPLRLIQEILHGAPNVSPRYFNCESNLLELYIFCPDGYIYTCPESIGNKDISIGRFFPSLVLSESGMSLWKDRNITNMEKCRECKFAPICGGGCPISSILINEGKEPICERYQEVLDTYLHHRGKKILKNFVKNNPLES